MSELILRNDAILILAKNRLREMELSERHDLLLDWWQLDDGDPEWPLLSEDLQSELREGDAPDKPEDSKYDQILLIAIAATFKGVRNEYIEKCLNDLGLDKYRVQGELEDLAACPCCMYKTLMNRGSYFVCPVCFWEDDGSNDPDRYSGVNKMSLHQAQENFKTLGAISSKSVKFVDSEGCEKYLC